MSAKSIAMLLCNGMSACMVLALFLTMPLNTCGGSLTGNVRIVGNENTTNPETTISQGTVRGLNMLTHHNRTVFGFIGIPYAQPPVGGLRFKAPVSAESWNGTLNATSDTKPCPQFSDEGRISGDEDCLYLNTFTPQLPKSDNSTLLPVMVYVIGGGFKTAKNSIERFPPDFLLDKDVVLVLPNFRVGVLGYLTTGDKVAPGNYGLKDLVKALEWIQENIQYFGGDPNQVTLFGGSSGAESVHLVALSNLTDGLFHKYITQSGNGFSSTVNRPREVCVNQAFQLGEYLGCPTNTSTLLVDCLRGLNISQLLNTNSIFYRWKSYPANVWTPTTEPDIEGALLTDTPANLYAAGKIRDLPYIAHVTRDEGFVVTAAFHEDLDSFEDLLNDIDDALPYVLEYHDTVDNVVAHTTALKSYYLNDLTANRSLLLANFTDLAGDAIFNYPTYDVIKQHLVLAKSPQYFSCLSYRGTFSLTYLFSGGSTGYATATHGDEIIYLFGHQGERFGPSDAKFSETDWLMVDTTPMVVISSGTTVWEPYSALNNYLQIGDGPDTALEMKYDLFSERMQFWDELTAATVTSGLFHRYITHGGTVFPVILDQPREVLVNRATRLGEHFQCPTNSSVLLVNCLRGFNASELFSTNSLFHKWRKTPFVIWSRTSEPDIEGALLTDTPANLWAAGKVHDLPWINGISRDKGLVFSIPFYEDPEYFGDFLANIDVALPYLVGYWSRDIDKPAYTAALKSFYFPDLSAEKGLLLTNLTHLLGDSQIIYSAYSTSQQQLARAKSPQYFYSFEYRGTFTYGYAFSPSRSTENRGVAHCDELIYLFGHQGERLTPPGAEFSDTDLVMVDKMVQLLASFVINGTPTTVGADSAVTWEPYSSLKNYLRIGNEIDTDLEMKYDLLPERMRFWDQLTRATSS